VSLRTLSLFFGLGVTACQTLHATPLDEASTDGSASVDAAEDRVRGAGDAMDADVGLTDAGVSTDAAPD
jgi:hypothetical protein